MKLRELIEAIDAVAVLRKSITIQKEFLNQDRNKNNIHLKLHVESLERRLNMLLDTDLQ